MEFARRACNTDEGAVESSESAHRLRKVITGLSEEEDELWKQLRRKRDFEDRVAEKRAVLVELRGSRRNASFAHAEATASAHRLCLEVELSRRCEREIRQDVAVLRESNRTLGTTFRQSCSQEPRAARGHDRQEGTAIVATDLRADDLANEDSPTMLHDQVRNLRGQLDRLLSEKSSMHKRQQELFDAQHTACQDRNKLLNSLQDDRRGINNLRSERIRVWEERCGIEREMAQVVQEALLNSSRAAVAASGSPGRSRWKDTSPFRDGDCSGRGRLEQGFVEVAAAAVAAGTVPPSSVAVSGGVRMPVVHDTPIDFLPPVFGSHLRGRSSSPRPHWTNFVDGTTAAVEEDGFPSGIGGSTPRVRQFSMRGTSPAGGAGEITDWSGVMRDFRASRDG